MLIQASNTPNKIINDPRVVRGLKSLDMSLLHFFLKEQIDEAALIKARQEMARQGMREGVPSRAIKTFDYHTSGWEGADFALMPRPRNEFAATIFRSGEIIFRLKEPSERGDAVLLLDYKEGKKDQEVTERGAKWW